MLPGGKKTIYWPAGILPWAWTRPYARGFLVEGKREGMWTFWFRSEKKQMEGEYREGKKEGLWTKWWENGMKASEGRFVRGKMHGRWADWYDDGQTARIAEWYQGKRNGDWTTYDRETGSVLKRERYDHTKEEEHKYALLTDREMHEIVRRAQRVRIHKNWSLLVGDTVARFMQAWHIALWIMVFVPVYAWAVRTTHRFAFLMALAVTSCTCGLIVLLVQWRESVTTPDVGTDELNQESERI
ncbi:toxin-antitoxin system YwqK family antitoxin [Thermodesulfobacteriota bacterium]